LYQNIFAIEQQQPYPGFLLHFVNVPITTKNCHRFMEILK